MKTYLQYWILCGDAWQSSDAWEIQWHMDHGFNPVIRITAK